MQKLHKFFKWAILIALVAGLAMTASTPARAQEIQPRDLGNATINAENPWPSTSPYPVAKAAEVAACQTAVGVYDPSGTTRWFDLTTDDGYAQMTESCLTGVVWFKDSAPTGTVFENADAMGGDNSDQTTTTSDTELMKLVEDVPLGVCTKEATREARLDCATKFYFDHGEKLVGFAAYARSLGATWDRLEVGYPFQPSADVLENFAPRIWGGVVLASNLKVTGQACLVTDVENRIASWQWAFLDDRYNPRPAVWHAGEAVSSKEFVEVAFHGDCSDWSEILSAMAQPGTIYRPYQAGNLGHNSTIVVPTAASPADSQSAAVTEPAVTNPADVVTKTVTVTETVFVKDVVTNTVTINADDPDGDGLIGTFDKCPNEAGRVTDNGCPVKQTTPNQADEPLWQKLVVPCLSILGILGLIAVVVWLLRRRNATVVTEPAHVRTNPAASGDPEPTQGGGATTS